MFKGKVFHVLHTSTQALCCVCSTDTHSEQTDVPLCLQLKLTSFSLLRSRGYAEILEEERGAVHGSVYSVLCVLGCMLQ